MADFANLGEISFKLTADTSGVERGDQAMDGLKTKTQDTRKSVDEFSKESQKAGRVVESETSKMDKGFGKVGGAVKMATVALTAFISVGGISSMVGQAAAFEQQMSSVQAITRSTTQDMEMLERTARGLGATTSFSAAEAAAGMQFLGMAGFKTNQIIKAMPATLALARAGALDLASAADIASNVLSGFRLQAEDMAGVADTLAAAASRSNTSVRQLGEALAYAAPFAAASGVEINTVTAAIGTLSDAGIQGSRAGTGLAGIFRQLANVTPNARDALASYGLTLADVSIETHGLETVMHTLRDANISTSDAFTIFGSEAGAAALVMINAADRVGELREELDGAAGEAQRMAEVMGDNLRGDIDKLRSALSETNLVLNDQVGLTSMMRTATQVATYMATVFNENGQIIGVMVKSIGAAALVYGTFATATGLATAAQWLFNRVAAANPYVLLAMGISAATVAVYQYLSAQGQLTSSVIDMWSDAERSADAYLVAQGSMHRHELVLDGLYKDRRKVIEDIAELEAMSASERANFTNQEVEARMELADIDARIHEVQDARIAADKAEAARREAAAQQQLETEGEILAQQQLIEGQLAALGNTGSKAYKDVDSAAKAFRNTVQSLSDRLDPASAKVRRYAEDQLTLAAALEDGIINSERYIELTKMLADEFEDTGEKVKDTAVKIKEEADPFAVAWEQAIKRVDGLLVDLWRDGMDGFDSFKDSLVNGFKQMLAEMAHAAITKPIMVSIMGGGSGSGGGGQAGGFDLSQMFGGGGGIGGMDIFSDRGISTLWGGGVNSPNFVGPPAPASYAPTMGQGFMSGAGAGLAAYGVTQQYGPIAGAAAGAGSLALSGGMQGMAAGGTFAQGAGAMLANPAAWAAIVLALVAGLPPQSPSMTVANVADPERLVDVYYQSDLDEQGRDRTDQVPYLVGGTMSSSPFGTIGFSRAGNVPTEEYQQIFDSIAAFDEQMAALISESELSAVQEAMSDWQYGGGIHTDPEHFGKQITARLVEITLAIDTTIAGIVGTAENFEEATAATMALLRMREMGKTPVSEMARTALETPVDTLSSVYERQTGVVRELTESFDGTIKATLDLHDAYLGQQQLAYQLATAYMQVEAATESLLGGLAERIKMDLMSSEELYNYNRAQAESLAAAIHEMSDPQEIMNAIERIEGLTSQLWGSLADEQKQIMGDEFLSFLEDTQTVASDRISGLLDGLDADQQSLKQAIDESLIRMAKEAGDKMKESSEEMKAAAEQMRLAAEQMAEAARTPTQIQLRQQETGLV